MIIVGKTIRLRSRTPDDSIAEMTWARDPEIVALDPPVGKIHRGKRFSIETIRGKHIGSCVLYGQTQSDIQLGIRIGDKDYWNKGYGTEAVGMLVNYCFAFYPVGSIWLKVLPQNTRAIRCYEKCGFLRSGRLALNGYGFITMEKRRDQWQKA